VTYMTGNHLKPLFQKLQIVPQDISHYIQALTHSSYANERAPQAGAHNERLEYLGDAILELTISEALFTLFPELPEGKLTRYRAGLVCEESLSRLARELDLGTFIRLGKGESTSGGRLRPSLLADALEALLGAVYLDLGFDEVRALTRRLFLPMFNDLVCGCLHQDYKTLLQEHTQAKLALTPEYQIISELGPDHAKTFIAQVLINNVVSGQGSGRTKKEAEQEAAREAYDRLAKAK
jgi:ribonuclease-3